MMLPPPPHASSSKHTDATAGGTHGRKERTGGEDGKSRVSFYSFIYSIKGQTKKEKGRETKSEEAEVNLREGKKRDKLKEEGGKWRQKVQREEGARKEMKEETQHEKAEREKGMNGKRR